MIVESYEIDKYINEYMDKNDVFILSEKRVKAGAGGLKPLYTYRLYGEPLNVLMSLNMLIEYEAKVIGVSYDDAITIMKNSKAIDKTGVRIEHRRYHEKTIKEERLTKN